MVVWCVFCWHSKSKNISNFNHCLCPDIDYYFIIIIIIIFTWFCFGCPLILFLSLSICMRSVSFDHSPHTILFLVLVSALRVCFFFCIKKLWFFYLKQRNNLKETTKNNNKEELRRETERRNEIKRYRRNIVKRPYTIKSREQLKAD